jgi:ATP-dependent exoDNAse (exonuclease V) alpha subunit
MLVLSEQQKTAFSKLISFTSDLDVRNAFILQGSAGTGKTRLLKEYTQYLELENITYQLLAPTGRATKILSDNTRRKAKTLHSFLYKVHETEKNGQHIYNLIPRKTPPTVRTIFIVDESSMIGDMPDDNLFHSQNSILYELTELLKSSPNGSKIIFVGDSYQLPPINENTSSALDYSLMKNKYKIHCEQFELTEVLRQESNSKILSNATLLRNVIERNQNFIPKLKYKNMHKLHLAVQKYCQLYDPMNPLKTVFIGWKNEKVDLLNNAIRRQLQKNNQDILVEGEQILLNRSIYSKSYIPTGEFGKVVSFNPNNIEKVADTRFGEAVLRFIDYNGESITVEAKIDIDFLLSDPLADSVERNQKLYANRMKYNKRFRESKNRLDDPYLNALKIKYGYAITCHKSQGGEWDNVFIYPEFPNDKNRLKWIYTSITRAKSELYSF